MKLSGRIAAACLAVVLSGCATYSDSVRDVRADVRAGRPDAALEHFNKPLETESWRELPPDLEDDRTLLFLERATLLQAAERYDTSARDMVIADQRLEWLDIDAYDRADLARWLYSDDAREYRAPAHERLLLNTLNMINFLAIGELEEARVEARRFELIEAFFVEEAEEPLRGDVRAVGRYLSGVAFEHSGDFDDALRHYEAAWVNGFRAPTFRKRIVDLHRVMGTNARGHEDDPAGLVDLVIEAQLKGALRVAEYRREHLRGDTVVVTQSGFAPYKIPERIPIGRAMVWAGAARSHYAMTSAERSQAQSLMAQGMLKWVNLPVLTDDGIPVDPPVSIRLDGEPIGHDLYVDVAEQVVASWQAVLGAVVASAITRLITRAVAGGATRVATSEIAKNSDGAGGAAIGILGVLASLAIEGGMAAADTPDTRSWTMLPGAIRVRRMNIEPGKHQLEVSVGSRDDRRTVNVRERGLTLVNFSRLR